MLSLINLTPRGLEPVTLTVASGSCLAIMGPSGAGKTVLLRAIADLDENSGDVETEAVGRSDVSAPDWRRSVVYVPADSGWWAEDVGSHLDGTEACLRLLRAVGLEQDCLTWEVARLSTGERQRLSLVRALLLKPDVLLLDEPTSALDETATAAVERVLTEHMTGGVTTVLVTHDRAQADRLKAQVVHLEHGRLTIGDGADGQ